MKARVVPTPIPANHPINNAGSLSQRVYSENTTAGNVCKIHTPPSNCRSIANCVGRKMMNTSAPSFTASDTTFALVASCDGVMLGWTSGFHKLRVKRLAEPIDMMAAGTSALIAIAAAAKPTNHDGNNLRNSTGTTSVADVTFTPAAIAM